MGNMSQGCEHLECLAPQTPHISVKNKGMSGEGGHLISFFIVMTVGLRDILYECKT